MPASIADILATVESWPRVTSDALTIVLLGTLALMLIWEAAAPYRALTPERNARWRVNFLLYVVGATLLLLLAPLSLVAVAQWATNADIGLFNRAPLPAWLAFMLSVLAMDLGKFSSTVPCTASRRFGAFIERITATARWTPRRACAFIRSNRSGRCSSMPW